MYPEDQFILRGDLDDYNIYLIPPADTKVDVLLDSLYASLSEMQGYHWLGDVGFVKELTNHLSNAHKHLLKEDSLNCAKEIGKFQGKVDKEYKEGKTNDHRFVTVEGWKFLYYNAQYILDRLPGEKKKK